MPTFSCSICPSRSFRNKDALEGHLRKSSTAHPYCEQCDIYFSSASAYNGHLNLSHPKVYRCPCLSGKKNKTFQTLESLREHYRGSLNHPNCPRCGVGCVDKAELKEHEETKHAKTWCEGCQDFDFVQNIEEHYAKSTNTHPTCVVCHMGFLDDKMVRDHVAAEHPDHYCKPCDRIFRYVVDLSDHFFVSSKHPKCGACNGKGFVDVDTLFKHAYAAHPMPKALSIPSTPTPMFTNIAEDTTDAHSPQKFIFNLMVPPNTEVEHNDPAHNGTPPPPYRTQEITDILGADLFHAWRPIISSFQESAIRPLGGQPGPHAHHEHHAVLNNSRSQPKHQPPKFVGDQTLPLHRHHRHTQERSDPIYYQAPPPFRLEESPPRSLLQYRNERRVYYQQPSALSITQFGESPPRRRLQHQSQERIDLGPYEQPPAFPFQQNGPDTSFCRY